MLKWIANLFFPPKCIFCRKVLGPNELDLCHRCWENAPEVQKSKIKYSFVARWTAVWYYKENARRSILRYKFYYHRSFAGSFGRFLAMKLQCEGFDDFDLMTWVPVAPLRRLKRGFDQVEDLAYAVGRELSVNPVKTLVKIRNTPPQSSIHGAAARRANVLGAFRVQDPSAVKGKRILLLDDVITTGATASECARTLLSAGAKEVTLAAIATAAYEK